jgi:hypothetical protein
MQHGAPEAFSLGAPIPLIRDTIEGTTFNGFS